MHVLNYTEWESITGWHCGDVTDLGKGSNCWWLPARMLDMTPAEYLKWVIESYHPEVRHSEDFRYIGFSWKNQQEERNFKNYINRIAKKKNFQICG